MTVQVNLVPKCGEGSTNSPKLFLLKFFTFSLPFLGHHFGFHIFFSQQHFWGPHTFFTAGMFNIIHQLQWVKHLHIFKKNP